MASSKKYMVYLPIFFACVLCFAACTESRPRGENVQNSAARNGDTWCIAKPSTDDAKLRSNIDYSCGQLGVNCSVIEEKGSCYHPNNLVSHASVAMNLHYKAAGKHTWDCYFDDTALTVTLSPSIGECFYV